MTLQSCEGWLRVLRGLEVFLKRILTTVQYVHLDRGRVCSWRPPWGSGELKRLLQRAVPILRGQGLSHRYVVDGTAQARLSIRPFGRTMSRLKFLELESRLDCLQSMEDLKSNAQLTFLRQSHRSALD